MSAPFSAALVKRLRAAHGFIFDMDGTLVLGDAASGGHQPLPGAIHLLAALRGRGIPFRVFTNGTAKPPATYAAGLRKVGFDLRDEEMMTPSTAAAQWFLKQGIGKVRVLGLDGVAQPLVAAGIAAIEPTAAAEGVEAVYTGWYKEFTFPALEAACQDLWAGARLTTASNVPFFATATGRAIGSSFAINAMLKAMTGKQARVLGKPSVDAFRVAMQAMGLPRTAAAKMVVVGDDPALEMRMAVSAGAFGVGMTTGLMKRGNVRNLGAAEKPHALLETLEGLADKLR